MSINHPRNPSFYHNNDDWQDPDAITRQTISLPSLGDSSQRIMESNNAAKLSLMRKSIENEAMIKNARNTNDPRHHLLQSARRRRAGTMPSMQFIPENGAIGMTETHYPMMNTSDLNSGRNRSGSLTLPSASVSAAFGNPIFSTSWISSDTQMQMMQNNDQLLGEEDANSIVQTLSSLGLDDSDVVTPKHVNVPPSSMVIPSNESPISAYHNPQIPYAPETPVYENRKMPSLGYAGSSAFKTNESYLSNQPNRPRAVSIAVPEQIRDTSYNMMSTGQWSTNAYQTQSQARPGPANFQQTRNRALSVGDTEWLRAQNARAELEQNLDIFAYTDRSASSSGNATPTRSLWIGCVDSLVTQEQLLQTFSPYGLIDSVRLIADKECAFVNFVHIEDAIRAKEDVLTLHNGRIGDTVVRIGYGKNDGPLPDSTVLQPTRALWFGNMSITLTTNDLYDVFKQFGEIESARVLTQKNCAFVNFKYLESAIRAKEHVQSTNLLGPNTRIGFAKVPTAPTPNATPIPERDPNEAVSDSIVKPSSTESRKQMKNELLEIVKVLAPTEEEKDIVSDDFENQRLYHEAIPSVIEFGPERKLDASALRELRKRLDRQDTDPADANNIAEECMKEIVELSSDYIGNTVVQRLFELCNDDVKTKMLEYIAPHLAAIGIHKNGTWAAQKIIECITTPEQMKLIREHVGPYVPPLLLDQFGNYMVQCCLALGDENNQFIVEAIVENMNEVAQGRYGSRAVRAILENASVSKSQQKLVAASMIQHTSILATNPNGTLLLNWVIESSGFPGRYQALANRLAPNAAYYCVHKTASSLLLKLINQSQDLKAQQLLLFAIFDNDKRLPEILNDQICGLPLVQKILGGADVDSNLRQYAADKIRKNLENQGNSGVHRSLHDLPPPQQQQPKFTLPVHVGNVQPPPPPPSSIPAPYTNLPIPNYYKPVGPSINAPTSTDYIPARANRGHFQSIQPLEYRASPKGVTQDYLWEAHK
ncbi:armadillo-type protein [Umbelopsis sp. PMI_123]|nr:armadillo-type protein [Umbelopsis sp. PMI_123]